ncbi:MAG: RNA pseudouridine synthase [Syntrophus sp. (in: bacteria)]|nr:RNA pseudouridine synthase [Syntrophus sp. (in: bacteria)]
MDNSFHIICDEDDTRLDVFLSEKLSLTRTKTKDMIEGGHVHVEGKVPKPSLKTKKSMDIKGEIPEEEPLSLTPEDIPLDILYEDEYLLAVNKPGDMVVHPSFGHASGTLVNAVLSYLEKRFQISNFKFQIGSGVRPGIVHRLDKGTTGVILIAKDSKTQEMLSDLFKERSITKTYRAIVEGDVKKERWIVEGNIGRHPVERKKMAVLKTGGRISETTFQALKHLNGFTYLEAYPKTGRTHQIRVHAVHGGYPIVGDEIYGKKAKLLTPRPLLHAYRIEFIHPAKKTPVKIEAPVPADMEDFIAAHNTEAK